MSRTFVAGHLPGRGWPSVATGVSLRHFHGLYPISQLRALAWPGDARQVKPVSPATDSEPVIDMQGLFSQAEVLSFLRHTEAK